MSASPARAPGEISPPATDERPAADEENDDDDESFLVAPVQDDDDDSPVGAQNVDSIADELARFRLQWQQELKTTGNGGGGDKPTTDVPSTTAPAAAAGKSPAKSAAAGSKNANSQDQQLYEKAKASFVQGVEFERKGMMHDAIRFYHAAVRLVPDIEKRLFHESNSSRLGGGSSTVSGQDSPMSRRSHSPTSFLADDNGPEIDGLDFVSLFLAETRGRSCQPHSTAAVDAGGRHFGDLPVPVIRIIFKWVVGTELDARQLEMLSMVCRGFYLIARDPELWRLICYRTWGIRTGEPNETDYMCSWRCMYVLRPHVWHNGVYISKVTYVRHGETSYQDQFYRPWHLIVYYRYMRLFADGTCVMLTTPEEPHSMVPYFKYKHVRYPGVYAGVYWQMSGDVVGARLVRQREANKPGADGGQAVGGGKAGKRARDHHLAQYEVEQHQSHLELRIHSTHHRRNNSLQFVGYTSTVLYRDGHQMRTEFDMNEQTFPALYFSRVKSYVVGPTDGGGILA